MTIGKNGMKKNIKQNNKITKETKTNNIIKMLFLALCFVGGVNKAGAEDVNVSTATEFGTAYTNAIKSDAADETTIILAAGTYDASETGLRWTQMEIPYKSVIVKAADGADVTLKIKVRSAEADRNGSLTFDGIKLLSTDANGFIDLGKNSADMGDIIFKNCEITATTDNPLNRCLITGGSNTADAYGSINSIQFDNCTIHDLGTSYNLIYTTKIVKSVSVTNSTLYNYGGESLFFARTASTDLAFSFTFTNNTVYRWAKVDNRRAFASVGGNYSSSSIYTFKDNIIDGFKNDGTNDYVENSTISNDNFVLVQSNNGGTINILNNILLGFKNGGEGNNKNNVVWATGGPVITNTNYWPWDATFSDAFGFTAIPFTDAANGDFTIEMKSYPAFATASTVGGPLGAPSTWKYTLTIGSALAATLVLPFETKIPTGITAYTLNYTSGAANVTTTEITTGVLPAHTPVLINATAEGNYTFVSTGKAETGTGTPTFGALHGAYDMANVPTDGTAYILQNQASGVGFYKVTESSTKSINPYRAYLVADKGSGAREFIGIGGTTAIETITPSPNTQSLPLRGESEGAFNLAGQRVGKDYKGIVIVNGKKMINK